MKTDLFDFDLPDSLIALHPASPRDSARMLVVGASGHLDDRHVTDLANCLKPGDVLVLNDTRVIRAALTGVRIRADARARVSINLLKRIDSRTWQALAKPAKKLTPGDTIQFGNIAPSVPGEHLTATVVAKREAGETDVAFNIEGHDLDAAIAQIGQMPLPPYIARQREPDDTDTQNYQTIYATRDGAVAAPTAGLHLSPDLMSALDARGITHHTLTLHVGAGTFLPVKADDVKDHKMHAEWGEVTALTADAINSARAEGRRIIAVGTTSLRLLESAARDDGSLQPFSGDTSIFIKPGYKFKVVDVLLTNFHLPRSTLFMLVSAFTSLETMQRAYAHAITSNYRFFSYGDATLLFRE